MALIPITSVHDGLVVLSFDVDALRNVVGWQVVNNAGVPVEVDVTVRGNRLMTVPFQPGTFSGTVQANRRWNMDDPLVDRSHAVTVRW